VCGKSFSQSSSLNSHMREHTSFETLGDLNSPMQAGEKPQDLEAETCDNSEELFTCPKCTMRFKHSGTLQIHMLVHSIGWHHKCEVCKLSFSSATAFKAHNLSQHSGESVDNCV
jgi:KRAB domain-containing zinc finger protein